MPLLHDRPMRPVQRPGMVRGEGRIMATTLCVNPYPKDVMEFINQAYNEQWRWLRDNTFIDEEEFERKWGEHVGKVYKIASYFGGPGSATQMQLISDRARIRSECRHLKLPKPDYITRENAGTYKHEIIEYDYDPVEEYKESFIMKMKGKIYLKSLRRKNILEINHNTD